MAIESRGYNSGIIPSATDFSASGVGQFKIVVLSNLASGQIAVQAGLVGTAGAIAAGILQNKPKVGEACDIMHVGISKVVVGAAGALAGGAAYESDALGCAQTAEVGKVGLGVVLIGAAAGGLATVTIGLLVALLFTLNNLNDQQNK